MKTIKTLESRNAGIMEYWTRFIPTFHYSILPFTIIRKRFLKKSLIYILILITCASLLSSCKKSSDAKLPAIFFKTGSNYTSANANVTTSDIINAGITADKNESDLRSFTVSYAYGSDVFTVKNTYSISEAQKSHFEKDYTIKPANSHGFETWKFEITDYAGNTNSVSFKLTVQ